MLDMLQYLARSASHGDAGAVAVLLYAFLAVIVIPWVAVQLTRGRV